MDSIYANEGLDFRMRSQYGFAIMFNGGCVAAGSGLGAFTVDSSSYADVYALHVVSNDIEFIQIIVYTVMGDSPRPCTIILEDNTTAIAVMTNNKSATRSRLSTSSYFIWQICSKWAKLLSNTFPQNTRLRTSSPRQLLQAFSRN